MVRTILVLSAIGLTYAPTVTRSQTPPPPPLEIATLLPAAAMADDEVGSAVSVSGDVAIIGARAGGSDFIGSATIFRRTDGGWEEEQHFVGNPNDPVQLFGLAVLIEGDTAFIGAPLFNQGGVNTGTVSIYRFDGATWNLTQVLTSPSPLGFGFGFGTSLALSGDVLLVGEPRSMFGGPDSGAASVFRFADPDWIAEATLLRANASPGDLFGTSVAISGNRALIGAPGVDQQGITTAGAAVFFDFDGTDWVEGQALAPTSPSGGSFGIAVALEGDRAFIGADEADSAVGPQTGSVSWFERNGGSWTLAEVMTPPDATLGSAFGGSIALLGDDLFVGARNQGVPGTGGQGATYPFRFIGQDWTPQDAIVAEGSSFGDDFGSSLAFDGETLLVGAPLDDSGAGTDSGSVRVVEVTPTLPFRRGDANRDGVVDIADPIWIHNFLFPGLGAATLPCELAADANDDEIVDLADVMRILEWLFTLGAPPLVAPECGLDPTTGQLGCELTSDCPLDS